MVVRDRVAALSGRSRRWLAAGGLLLASCRGPTSDPELDATPDATDVSPGGDPGNETTTAAGAIPEISDGTDTDGGEQPAAIDTAPPERARPRGLESGPASPEIVAVARKIQSDLECIRGVRFKKDVGVEFQSLDDFEAFLERQLAKEMGDGKDVRSQRLLHALGLMSRDTNLMQVMRQATLEQAAAYYDPDTDTFYVVQSMPELALKSVMAHELQHALQDQHTKLLDRYTAGEFDTLDAELAARFLVEGEATMVGHAWTMAHVGDGSLLLGQLLPSVCHLPGRDEGDPQLFWPSMQDMLVTVSEQSRADIQDPGLLTKLATRAMSESMYASMQGLRDLPNFVFYSLLLPYNFGGLTVFTVFQQARYDWRAVDRLFDDPPQSSEQVLHPNKLGAWRGGKGREGFRRPRLARAVDAGDHAVGWSFDPEDRVGELGLRIWFIERGATENQAALLASGWNGDTVRVWWRTDDDQPRLAFEWKLAWDGPDEARRFKTAFAKSLPNLHPEMIWTNGEAGAIDRRSASGRATYRWTDPSGVVRHGKLEWSGDEVFASEGWLRAP